MKDHLPPSVPIRTYHFGTDIPIAGPDDQDTNEMAAYGEPDEFAGRISARGWILLVLAVLAWAAAIGAVYVAMVFG